MLAQYRQIQLNSIPAASKQPKTLQHEFTLSPLRTHFIKTPNPSGANRLIDLPSNEFLDTEDEFNMVAAALWILCVRWDRIDEVKRPKTRSGLRDVSLRLLKIAISW